MGGIYFRQKAPSCLGWAGWPRGVATQLCGPKNPRDRVDGRRTGPFSQPFSHLSLLPFPGHMASLGHSSFSGSA